MRKMRDIARYDNKRRSEKRRAQRRWRRGRYVAWHGRRRAAAAWRSNKYYDIGVSVHLMVMSSLSLFWVVRSF